MRRFERKEIYTAICVDELTEELNFENIHAEEVNEDHNAQISGCYYNTQSLLAGLSVGILVQVTAISAYTFSLIRWGPSGISSDATLFQRLIYDSVLTFSQLDIALYFVIWIIFMLFVSDAGKSCLRRIAYGAEPPQQPLRYQSRFLFRIVLYFFGGLIIGSYAVWTRVDYLLGLPVPVLPIISALVVSMSLCCLTMQYFDVMEDDEDELVLSRSEPNESIQVV